MGLRAPGPFLFAFAAPVIAAGFLAVGGSPLLHVGSPESAAAPTVFSAAAVSGPATVAATGGPEVIGDASAQSGAAAVTAQLTLDPFPRMALAWRNNLRDAVSVTASASETEFPAANAAKDPPSRHWRAGSNSAFLDIEAKGAPEWQLVYLVNTTLVSGATMRIRLSNVQAGDGEAFDSGPFTPQLVAGYADTFFIMHNPVTARFARIDLANPAPADVVAIGLVFAGPCWFPSIPDAAGRELWPEDRARSLRSHAGETWVGPRARSRMLAFDLPRIETGEALANVMDMDLRNGMARGMVAILDRVRFPHALSLYGVARTLEPHRQETARYMAKRYIIRERT